MLHSLCNSRPHPQVCLVNEGDIICAKHDTNIEILTCNNSIDQMIHKNLKRKMEAMYTWLNDPNLNPQLGILEPTVSDEEIAQW